MKTLMSRCGPIYNKNYMNLLLNRHCTCLNCSQTISIEYNSANSIFSVGVFIQEIK